MLQYPTLRVRFLKRYNRGEFLLEFFSSYDTTDDSEKNTLSSCCFNVILIHGSDICILHSVLSVFAFLRLAAAIWMCSPDHITMYAPGVIGPGEGRSLEDVSCQHHFP
jgi:hypothetical protein